MRFNRWEVVSYSMDKNFCNDRTVAPRVLRQFCSRWMAERYEYRIARSRALSSMTPDEYRKTMTGVRRVGDWMPWSYVQSNGDLEGAEDR